ncbi:uncharacterized protein LOC126809500 [Patella vulgata]|uniref:uncharacterized protein LOC126809500 n=1 Tax=Patella vulgata TaxID=6465 RepID=UPI0024A8247B|nr:uncharacterized protein LOC126809500 [Patella vulgata]
MACEAFFGYTKDNNCRNPGRSQSSAWCYAISDNGYEHCFIPQCRLLLKNRELTRPLMIQKDKLSSTVRKMSSAYDPRISSQNIGAVSVALVLGTIFIIM